jgi:hypothetical protein
MSRNPYCIEGQEPTLRRSVFALMDILGYTEIIRSAHAAGSQEVTLRKIHGALTTGRNWLEDKDLIPELVSLTKTDRFALKAFTDNIVMAWPIRDDAESELGEAFDKLASFQFQMVLEGFFVRGAVAIGEAYVDEVAVFGSALVEAYAGETTLARDPRIILTPSVIEAIKQHLSYYSDSHGAPQVRDVLRDADGQWFLNYLDTVLMAENDHGPFYNEFLQHKSAVEEKLSEHQQNPAFWAKYAWVAGYHNYFCDLHSHHFSDEYKINVELFRSSPKLIVDN